MSQDRFWEQWGQQEPAPGAGSPPATPGPDRGTDLGNLNFDALSAWLSDSPAPAVTAPPSPSPTASPATADLSGVWPSSATSDPFAAILSPGGAPAPAPPGGANWDLVIEPTPSRAAPPAAPSFGAAPGPDPFLNPPAGVYGSSSAAPAGYGVPQAAPAGYGAPPASIPPAPPVPTPTFGMSPTPAGVIDLGPLGPDPAFDLAGLGGAPPSAAPVYPTAAVPAYSAAATPPSVSAPIASPYAGGAGSGGGGFPAYPGSPYTPPVVPPAHPPLASETVVGIRPIVPALLKVEISSGARTVEKEIQGEALIGRPDAARGVFPQIDLRLDDAVSRRHARIYEKEGRFYLMDLNSTNGTRYNQQFLDPETPVPLLVGDQIEVGETVIRVLASPGVSA